MPQPALWTSTLLGLAVRWDVESAEGATVTGELHGTIHERR